LKGRSHAGASVAVELAMCPRPNGRRSLPTVRDVPGRCRYSGFRRDRVAQNWIRGTTDVWLIDVRSVCSGQISLAKSFFPLRHRRRPQDQFRGINYSVAGVLERQKAALLAAIKTGSWPVPISTGLNRYGARYRSLSILVQAQNQPLFEDTMEQVRGALRMIRKVPPASRTILNSLRTIR